MWIYKICSRDAWQQAAAAGTFVGAEIDLQDGYIHFSTAAQVKETVAKHFHGQSDLVLVAVESEQLGEALKWEVSRGGAEFPHLYSALDTTLANRVDDLPLDADGGHIFPASLG